SSSPPPTAGSAAAVLKRPPPPRHPAYDLVGDPGKPHEIRVRPCLSVTALFGVRPWLASVAGIVALSVTTPAFGLIAGAGEVRWGHDAQAARRKQAPLVSDPAIGRYVTSVGHRLASRVSGPKYPY